MPGEQYEYQFELQIDMAEVEDSLALAALGAASLRGETAVALGAFYHLSSATRAVTIDTSSEVGAELNRLFYGFIVRAFGNNAFLVRRLNSGRDDSRNAA